jgi:hypothetical protein
LVARREHRRRAGVDRRPSRNVELVHAAEEINSELGYSVDRPAPSPVPPLVVGVNLDRAVEHWRQSFSPFGVIGVGSEGEPVLTARNSWYRHHLKLAPLKTLRGVA